MVCLGDRIARGWELGGCGDFVEGSSKDRRRITEGSPREGFGGHKCPPTGRKRTRELSRQNRDTQWKGWRGGEKKKKKPPQEKSPQQKKRNRCLRLRLLTGGCAALLSRFFSLFLRRLRRLLLLPSPRFSLLLWAAAPPLLFASPLALLSGGCAAHTSSLSRLFQHHGARLTCHKLFFFYLLP